MSDFSDFDPPSTPLVAAESDLPFRTPTVADSPSPGRGVAPWYVQELPPLQWSRWMGLLHLVLGFVLVFVTATVGLFIGLAVTGTSAAAIRESVPSSVLVASMVSQQSATFFWPMLVSLFWSGWGAVKDWGLRFEWIDLLGFPVAIGLILVVNLVSFVTAALIGLEDTDQAGNTQFLLDAVGTIWIVPLVFGAVIGAPFAEEIFFRGLAMRSLERFGGPIVGVGGSTVLFTILHTSSTPTLKGMIVLWIAIGSVGLILGLIANSMKRLGMSIFAHVVFNGVQVAALLATGGSTSAGLLLL